MAKTTININSEKVNKDQPYFVKADPTNTNLWVVSSLESIEYIKADVKDHLRVHPCDNDKCFVEFTEVNDMSEWRYYLIHMTFEDVNRIIDNLIIYFGDETFP